MGKYRPKIIAIICFFQSSNNDSVKVIPRLVDSAGNTDMGDVCPEEWNVFDVAQFLRVNDCANYCDSFSKQVSDFFINFFINISMVLHFYMQKVLSKYTVFHHI